MREIRLQSGQAYLLFAVLGLVLLSAAIGGTSLLWSEFARLRQQPDPPSASERGETEDTTAPEVSDRTLILPVAIGGQNRVVR